MISAIQTKNLLNSFSSSELKVLDENVYEISHGNISFVIEVLKIDLHEKTMTIRSSHRVYDLIFKDELDLVLDKMGIKRSTENVARNVKAPMPGKVIDVLAKEGDKILKGDNILILEAMKMENVIKAEIDCTVLKIHISKQDNVEKNQVLVELDF